MVIIIMSSESEDEVVAAVVGVEQDVNRFNSEDDIRFIRGVAAAAGLLVLLLGVVSTVVERVFSFSWAGIVDGCGGFGSFFRRIILMEDGFIGDVMTIFFI